jgi:hypothetical protein
MKIISNTLSKNVKNNLNINKIPLFNFSSVLPINNISHLNSFYKYPIAFFAKKGGDKNDKKTKKEKEKETINKEYSNVSVEELKSKYKTKTDNILNKFKEELNEFRVQRSNPKILDGTQV